MEKADVRCIQNLVRAPKGLRAVFRLRDELGECAYDDEGKTRVLRVPVYVCAVIGGGLHAVVIPPCTRELELADSDDDFLTLEIEGEPLL